MTISQRQGENANRPTAHAVPFTQSGAAILRKLELPRGVQLCQYANANEHVFYEENKIHTFSMYLKGGHETQRTDKQSLKGAPGRFCLMPAGSYSAWHIGGGQEFLHIYFDDEYIKRLALENFDIDPRAVALPQLTFESSDSLLALTRHSLLNWEWHQADHNLRLHHSLQTLLLAVLQTIGLKKIRLDAVPRSGLSPYIGRRVDEYIRTNLHRQILLAELADVAGSSEFHFSRMFKISRAETPQNCISRLRVESLQHALQNRQQVQKLSMAQLAYEHGFSSQSHMGRVFKQYTGISPGRFSKLL